MSDRHGPSPFLTLASRRALVLVLLALLLAKLVLAASLPLFGDESFYWAESRALAPGYSDVPLLTPWLIALGTAIAGHREIGVRWPFVLLGSLLPLLVLAMAKRHGGAREARAAALLALLLPLSATLGVFALPDVPLTLAVVGTALALDRASRDQRTGDLLLLGLVLALGWMAHYRFALAYLALALFVLGTARGRALLGLPGFWLAQAIGLAGLAPALVANAAFDWAGFRFQFVERHAWRLDPSALLDLAVQMLVTTPLLFGLLAAAMALAVARRDRSDGPWGVVAAFGAGYLLACLAAGFVVGSERVRFHWPLPAYLVAAPAMIALASGASGRRRALDAAAVAIAAAGSVALLAVLALAARPAGDALAAPARPLPDNLQGWREFGAWAETLADRHADAVLIADHFMTAAQWRFALGDARRVFALDHPLNEKHGRAAQLAHWRLDQAALDGTRWRRGLLVVEESSRREIDRLPMWRALCDRFARVDPIDELALFGGRWRFVAFAVEARGAAPGATRCRLPAMADFSQPLPGARLEGPTVTVHGWAIREFEGVAGVDVVLDGEVVATARYGLPFPGVRAQWPASEDPNHPQVGFEADVALAPARRGAAVLALRVRGHDGSTRLLAQRRVVVAP